MISYIGIMYDPPEKLSNLPLYMKIEMRDPFSGQSIAQ